MKLEISELENAITNGKEQIKASEKAIVDLNEVAEQASIAKDNMQEEAAQAQAELKEVKQAMAVRNKEVQKKLNEKSKLLSQNSELELELQKNSHSIGELKTKYKDCQVKVIHQILY